MRTILLAVLLAAACGDDRPRSNLDAQARKTDAAVTDSGPTPDVPPPSVDAAPPPMPACGDAGTCAFPPSTCLDSNYLVYYTGGSCANGTCQFTTNTMYCYGGCMNGGCLGGFT